MSKYGGATVEGAKLARWWTKWGAFVMAALFVGVFSVLAVRKHDSFHTRALDLAKFDQAIWNTLYGRFLFSSLQDQSILGNHFSPYMAVLAPLFLIWSDVRLLFLVQMVGLAAAGLLLYQIVRRRHTRLALWFLLAFYLNPALHEVALVEFRRITLAVPFLAMALYALYARKRWLMALGLGIALLCKENVGLIVFMVGVYLLIFERDWRWGSVLMVVGAMWTVAVMFWVIPAFRKPGEASSLYPQRNYLGLAGDSYSEMLRDLLRDPFVLFRRAVDRKALAALLRVFSPLGFVLPFLAPDFLLLALPSFTYMLISAAPGMHELREWYMASVLPLLFASIAVGVVRLSERRARWLIVGLLGMTVVGYGLYSHAPLGGKYDPSLYRITAHHRLASMAVDAVPANARVAAQDPYVPHLSHREHIYLYPWISIGLENIDYLVLDRYLHPYPMQPASVNDKIDDLVADVSYVIEMEADGIYVFHQGGTPLPSFPIGRVAEGSMKLDRVEIAPQDDRGLYRTASRQPIELNPGQQVRVSLYWEALTTPGAERTVSVRIADASGALVAAYDNLPGRGKKPTSWWREGWQVRDVYYLTVSPDAQLGPGRLDVVIYDSFTGEMVPFEDYLEVLTLVDVVI